MKLNRSIYFTSIVLFLVFLNAAAQKKKALPVKTKSTQGISSKKTPAAPQGTKVALSDPAQDEKKVKDMVSFLGYMLNTLGNNETSARDKDVLVTESYSKIFRDSKVQVEDDLDENRSVITNKDVVAYLKDINFFFKDVKFELNIDKIERGINADNQTFYKVTLHRNLVGTTSDGKTMDNTAARFIELNFSAKDQDLKIVSIYTHEFDEKGALVNWWKGLSFEWQSIFKKRFNFVDSLRFEDIKRITAIEDLDVSNNRFIQSFEPLTQFKNLKSLNLSRTGITDLWPIRNLSELTELNLSGTPIHDLAPLRYLSKMVKLNLNNTAVTDISILQRMQKLQSLDLGNTNVTDIGALALLNEITSLNFHATRISDISPIQGLNQLVNLNISRSSVQDISSLASLKNLTALNCDSTKVQNFSTCGNLENLKTLYANSTLIADLQPFQKLSRLEKIYCDQTLIKKNIAESFMLAHSNVTVVYNSHDLKLWWDGLESAWKISIAKATKISSNPTNEELTRIGNLDSISIEGATQIKDVEPLRKFQRLRVIRAKGSGIHDLSPLKELTEIKYLDVSHTNVTDLSPISQLNKLQVLKSEGCKIESIDPLQKTKSLQRLYVDETMINDINAYEFLQTNPKCLLIYKTVHLKRWWRNLSENWREIFLGQLQDTTREGLHKLVEQESFHFKDSPVADLSGLTEFMRLKELHFSGSSITEFIPAENLKAIRSLQISNSPIQNVQFVGLLSELEELDISNTPVEDLTPVWTLQKLRTLNCAGTQIKRLDAIEKIEGLETLDCSNTNVSRLAPLDYLHLKSLKCYNTRVSNRSIENFIASHPNCKVTYYR